MKSREENISETVLVAVRLSPEMNRAILQVQRTQDINKSQFIRRALRRQLKEMGIDAPAN